MNELFRAVSERLKSIFTAHAALELEAELIARHVQRKATLLRQAAQLESEGLNDLASELRTHASAMDVRKPAETVLALLEGPKTDITAGETQSESTSRRKKR
jgi:hypothetical protein